MDAMSLNLLSQYVSAQVHENIPLTGENTFSPETALQKKAGVFNFDHTGHRFRRLQLPPFLGAKERRMAAQVWEQHIHAARHPSLQRNRPIGSSTGSSTGSSALQ